MTGLTAGTTGPGRRSGRHAPVSWVAAALLVALLVYILRDSPNFRAAIPGGDYLQFYVAARVVRDGHADRLYDFALQDRLQHDPAAMPFPPDSGMVGLYVYPPFFVWFCLPFSYLGFRAGASAWVLVMAGCLVASLRLLVRGVRDEPAALGLALLAALVFSPTLMALMSCQNATLSLLILSATYALLRSGRERAAGAVYALLAFKPQLTPLIAGAMLLKGRWRFVQGASLGGVGLVLAALAVSPAATAAYLRLGPTLSRWIEMPGMPLEGMSCWHGFWRLLLADRPLRVIQAAAGVSSLATLVPVAWSLRGPLRPTDEGFALRYSALVLATVLVSPHLLAYDLTILILPMLLVAVRHRTGPPQGAPDRLWPHLTALVYAVATVSRSVAAVTHVQAVVPVLFAYLVVVATEVQTGRRSGVAPGVPSGGPARS